MARVCPSPAVQALGVTDCAPLPPALADDASDPLLLEENVDTEQWPSDTGDLPINALTVFAPPEPFDWAADVEASFEAALPLSALAVDEPLSLSAFLAQPDTSMPSFSAFLAPHGLEPFSPGPLRVRDDSGCIWLVPTSRKALLAFWRSSWAARQTVSTPWLARLCQRRRPFNWLYVHALEYLRLQIELNRRLADHSDGNPPSTPDLLPPSVSAEIDFSPPVHAVAAARLSPTPAMPTDDSVVRILPPASAPLLKRYRQARSAPLYADPPVVRIRLNGHPALLTLDSGAAISVINERYLHSIVPHADIRPSPLAHLSAFGTQLTPVGQFDADVVFEHHTALVRLPVL
jgi:hypothetical protein